MSTHVVGIKPPDDRWRAMKAIWDACETADVAQPDEVLEFFGDEPPNPDGVIVELEKVPSPNKANGDPVAIPWTKDMKQGFRVDVAGLPPDVKIIWFYNSW